MLPVLLTGGLIAGLFQPVSFEEEWGQRTPRSALTNVRNLIRGRILASFVKPGMAAEEASAMLGFASSSFGGLRPCFEAYDRLGVDVNYRVNEFQVAGENGTQRRWVVESVRAKPLSDLLPRFPFTRAEKPPDR
jgi:hypothetical protein